DQHLAGDGVVDAEVLTQAAGADPRPIGGQPDDARVHPCSRRPQTQRVDAEVQTIGDQGACSHSLILSRLYDDSIIGQEKETRFRIRLSGTKTGPVPYDGGVRIPWRPSPCLESSHPSLCCLPFRSCSAL